MIDDATQLPEISTEAKTVLSLMEGGEPNASLALIQGLLGQLKITPLCYKDNKILLDMQELLKHLPARRSSISKK